MKLMFNGIIKRVLTLQTLFNNANNSRDRLAYAAAMRNELMRMVDTLDSENVLPTYQEAVAKSAIQELGD